MIVVNGNNPDPPHRSVVPSAIVVVHQRDDPSTTTGRASQGDVLHSAAQKSGVVVDIRT